MVQRIGQEETVIVCTGEALIDFVPEDPANPGELPDFRPVAGGSPFNCAIAASRLGSRVAFASVVSTDFFGDHLVARLAADGVGLDLISRADKPSTLAFVSRSDSGSVSYAFFTRDAADRSFRADLIGDLPPGNILQFGSISLIGDPGGGEILSFIARESSRQVVAFDPNIRPSLVVDDVEYRRRLSAGLSNCAILKTSDEDLAWIYPGADLDEAVQRVTDLGVRTVIVTQGADGATAFTSTGTAHVPTKATRIVDTIGAGDSFLAAVLVWLDERGVSSPDEIGALTPDDMREALTFATKVAAITCGRTGADPPRRSELA